MALTGNSIEEKVWNYLKAKGLNNYAIAGLMGNIYAESGIIANRLEMLCIKRLKENGMTYTDATYTSAVDNGKISKAEFLNPLPGKQYGYGFCQWTSPGRKAGLYDLVKERKVSIGDAEAQLDFLWSELSKSHTSVMSTLKSATSVKEASDVVLIKFECPADKGDAVKNTRANYGQKYYDKYAKSTSSVQNTGGNKMTESELRRKVANWLAQYQGISEGSAKHKEILAVYNNSRLCTRYTMTVNDAWCQASASAAAIATGLSDIIPIECSCNMAITLWQKKGRWIESDSYVPKVGDYIYYDWDDSGAGECTGGSEHVGIVYNVSGSTLTIVEGNKSNTVSFRTIQVNGRYIRGYGIPNYASKVTSSSSGTTIPSTPSSSGSKLNATVSWNGVVIADELNVRTWAGTENKTCSFSPLKRGVVVGVCDSAKASNGAVWYYIKYNGKYGFVSSAYITKQATSSPTASTQAKVDGASSFDKSIAGAYKTTSGLNLRTGAGTSKTCILTIPCGDKVNCYGYYTTSGGVKWYLVTYKTYTGFVSSKYLKK